MKTFVIGILFAVSILAQAPSGQGERALPVIQASPQKAQDVVVHLTADAATALESMRLSTPGPRDAKGVSAPQFATIQDLWNTLTAQLIRNVVQKFPPATIKAAQDAASKATADAQAAAAAAVTTK